MLLAFCSCGTDKTDSNNLTAMNIETPLRVKTLESKLAAILFHTDEKIYFSDISGDTLCLYLYEVTSDVYTKIGEIKNFLLSNQSVSVLNGKAYFFVTTDDLLGKKNCFYCIDTATDKLKKIYSERLYQSFNYLTVFNGKLYSTKGDKVGQNGVTYIEEYDIDTKKRKTVMQVKVNHTDKTGEIILNIASNGVNFYLYSQRYEDNKIQHYCDTYNSEFCLVESKKIDLKGKSEIFQNVISRFAVKDGNIYMQNLSNSAMLEDINGKNKSIITDFENPLWLSYRFSDKQPWIFYYRGQTDIYSINSSGELKKSEKFKISEGYAVNMVTQYDESVIVSIRNKENPDVKEIIFYRYTDLF